MSGVSLPDWLDGGVIMTLAAMLATAHRLVSANVSTITLGQSHAQAILSPGEKDKEVERIKGKS